jgi:hypothetical protein
MSSLCAASACAACRHDGPGASRPPSLPSYLPFSSSACPNRLGSVADVQALPSRSDSCPDEPSWVNQFAAGGNTAGAFYALSRLPNSDHLRAFVVAGGDADCSRSPPFRAGAGVTITSGAFALWSVKIAVSFRRSSPSRSSRSRRSSITASLPVNISRKSSISRCNVACEAGVSDRKKSGLSLLESDFGGKTR